MRKISILTLVFLLIFATQAVASKSIVTKPVVYDIQGETEITKDITGYYSNVPGYGEIFFECDATGNDTGYAWVPSNLGTIKKEGDAKLPIDWNNPISIKPLIVTLEMPNITTSLYTDPGITYGNFDGGWEWYIPDQEDRLLIARVENTNSFPVTGEIAIDISGQGHYSLNVDLPAANETNPKDAIKNYFVCYITNNAHKHNCQDGPNIKNESKSKAWYSTKITGIGSYEPPAALKEHSFKPTNRNISATMLPKKYELSFHVLSRGGRYAVQPTNVTAIYDPLSSKWDINAGQIQDKYANILKTKLDSMLFTTGLNRVTRNTPLKWDVEIDGNDYVFVVGSVSLSTIESDFNMQKGFAQSEGKDFTSPVIMDRFDAEFNMQYAGTFIFGTGTVLNARSTDMRYYDLGWMKYIPLMTSEPITVKKHDYTINDGIVELDELKDTECYRQQTVLVERPYIAIRNGVDSISIRSFDARNNLLGTATWTPSNGLEGELGDFDQLVVGVNYNQALVAINPSKYKVEFLSGGGAWVFNQTDFILYDPASVNPQDNQKLIKLMNGGEMKRPYSPNEYDYESIAKEFKEKTYLQNAILSNLPRYNVKWSNNEYTQLPLVQDMSFDNTFNLGKQTFEVQPEDSTPIHFEEKTAFIRIANDARRNKINASALIKDILAVMNKEYEAALSQDAIVRFHANTNHKLIGLAGLNVTHKIHKWDRDFGGYVWQNETYRILGNPAYTKSYFTCSSPTEGVITRRESGRDVYQLTFTHSILPYNIYRNNDFSLPFYPTVK